jgi:hypothetical protein
MTTKPFYTEANSFILDYGDQLELYHFDLAFDYKNNLKNIKMQSSFDTTSHQSKYFSDSLFTPKDKQEISKLIALELVKNENDFWWEITDKGLLTLSLKSEKENVNLTAEDKEQIDKIKANFRNGILSTPKSESSENFFEKIAGLFPWNFLNPKLELIVQEEYMSPSFNILKDNTSLISISYQTNETIKDKKDAIAGLSYISDKQATTSWKSLNRNQLSPGNYNHLITSGNGNIQFKVWYKIEEGASDLLSKTTNQLLGSPSIDNKSIATLLQYNIVYMKIGIVTIIISLFVLLISPFIKKLMHGIH